MSAHAVAEERDTARAIIAARAGLRDHRVPLVCLGVFSLVWLALAIRPVDRGTWLLENILTIVVVGWLLATYRRSPFGNAAYVQGTAFLVLHTVGSHYTYSLMPLGEWLQEVLALQRNGYDRLVHFSSGLLLFPAMAEAAGCTAIRDTGRRAFLSFCVVAWWSVFYELAEWLVAVVIAPEQGPAFLATQGDAWDAQKDMALALAGAAIRSGMLIVAPRLHRSRHISLEASHGARAATHHSVL